jgi:hypothetical protein
MARANQPDDGSTDDKTDAESEKQLDRAAGAVPVARVAQRAGGL